MIFNLIKYLQDQFPNEVFYVNGYYLISGQQSIADRCHLVKETGGIEIPRTRYNTKTIQIISRDESEFSARELAWSVYKEITDVFGLTLPIVTVGGIVYNSIQTAQISAIQQPFCLGADEESRIEFATNYEIIYRRI